MGWSNLIVGARAIHNSVKAYVNVVNGFANFVETNPPTNINTNETILKKYSIKQGLKLFVQKCKDGVQK